LTILAAKSLSEVSLGGCRLLILDFDGVITRLDVDWRRLKHDLATLCRREYGLENSFSPLSSGRHRILGEAGAEALSAVDALLADREMKALGTSDVSPDLLDLLSRNPGTRLAVFSSNSRRVLEAAVDKFGLRDRVDAIVGREDVERAKPDPEGLHKILSSTGCNPGDALFLGDRNVDGHAGAAAGIRTYVLEGGEAGRLEAIARGHSYEEGFNGRLVRYRARAIMRMVPRGGTLLELGCAGGALAEGLMDHFWNITVVEAAETFLDDARRRLGSATRYHHGLLEVFETQERFDCVLASGVLEHVEDPVAVIRRASGWIKNDGVAVFLVPNARALHRRVGLAMGLLKDLQELQAHDHEVGHRRYYTIEMLRAHVEAAGMEVQEEAGVFLKPLANWQMEGWDDALADAFYEVGLSAPELCAELILACRRVTDPR
jgi:HAD superfamily hydrolase (TIGR01549 family)